MAGLPKKYFKMFPGNLKRAWAKFKADRGKGSSSAVSKSGGHSGGHKSKGGKMGKRKGQAGFAPMGVLMFAGQAAAGGVGSSLVVNKTPGVKDMDALVKSGAQIAVGLAGLFFLRKRWMKGVSAGAVIAGVMGGTKSLLKLDPLAGPGYGRPTLTADQMRRLTNGRMGLPVSNVRMGVPANVRMGGAGSSGWGRGGFG